MLFLLSFSLHVITTILLPVTMFWLISANGWYFVLLPLWAYPKRPSGEGQGRLYLGSAAMENEHYSQQYALAAHLGAAMPGLHHLRARFSGLFLPELSQRTWRGMRIIGEITHCIERSQYPSI